MKYKHHNIYTIIKEVIAEKDVCLTKDIEKKMMEYGLITCKMVNICNKIQQNFKFWPDLEVVYAANGELRIYSSDSTHRDILARERVKRPLSASNLLIFSNKLSRVRRLKNE